MRIIPQLTMMIAEFDKTNLEENIRRNYSFRKGSPVQLYCKYLNEYHIKGKQYDSYHQLIENSFFEELKHKTDGYKLIKEMLLL
jgi:hypothetical protein